MPHVLWKKIGQMIPGIRALSLLGRCTPYQAYCLIRYLSTEYFLVPYPNSIAAQATVIDAITYLGRRTPEKHLCLDCDALFSSSSTADDRGRSWAAMKNGFDIPSCMMTPCNMFSEQLLGSNVRIITQNNSLVSRRQSAVMFSHFRSW